MATHNSSLSDSPIITINVAITINKKLTPATFPQWWAQFEALLISYDLIDFVTGKLPYLDLIKDPFAPSKTANSD